MSSEHHGVAASAITTIFVLEPDVLVRIALADYLRECGYKVLEGATADDALAFLDTGQKIDVIIAEVRLPGRLDGFGLARWIRRNHPGIDVILTSGIAGAAETAGDLCDDGPVGKPYHPQEVVRRINILIERRRSAFRVDRADGPDHLEDIVRIAGRGSALELGS
jgi:DNA-binding response OmpR family regulator